MNIIKRSGEEQPFDSRKIRNAIRKANASVSTLDELTDAQMDKITEYVTKACSVYDRPVGVEEIQDIVEKQLMAMGAFDVAKNYVVYRYKRSLARKSNTTDESILALIKGSNAVMNEENSNKNTMTASTQRDYIAGIISRDMTTRLLLPEDVARAHEDGILHFHDADYFIQHIFNCCLINLEDMLGNGTVISNARVDPPKSFSTACTIATQIVAEVASNQYGGQSISLAHLARYVEASRQHIRERLVAADGTLTEAQLDRIAEAELSKEIERGVQTLQYQINTLLTTNGQTPFVTVFMYLNEARGDAEKQDLARVIEEVLKQRMQGIKNEKGVWVTPAFPKLIYVLQEDNIHEDDRWFYLTRLAAECTAKRLVPDYISEKVMKESKVDRDGNGQCYPCMGCIDGRSVISYRLDGKTYTESIERAWNRLADSYTVETQPNGSDLYIDTSGVSIWDTQAGAFVQQERIIRNTQSDWVRVTLSGGRCVDVTADHPFEVEGRGVVLAQDLSIGDRMLKDTAVQNTEEAPELDLDAWAKGLVVCDGCYDGSLVVSLGMDETDIEQRFSGWLRSRGYEPYTRTWDRGVKGRYKDVHARRSHDLCVEFKEAFEGVRKENRSIGAQIAGLSYASALSFLAGIVDADGYVNNRTNSMRVQVGSTNRELAVQEMLLAQACGMSAYMYCNRYRHGSDKIRWRVEFVPTQEFVGLLASEKKRTCFNADRIQHDKPALSSRYASVIGIETYCEEKFSYDVTTETEHFTFDGIWSHNCRSFLTPYVDADGKPKYYGRFNQGVVTINLPDAAMAAEKDLDRFWQILDERLELCHRALQVRHERLHDVTSDVSPIHWQHGAIARLGKGESVAKLLHDGYSTLSLGYAGLWECVYALIGKKLTEPEGEQLGLDVMKKLNEYTAKWKAAEHIDYSLYGTPIETLTYKFAKALQRHWGVVPGVSDKGYVTNSYHVHVTEPIDAFAKLALEARFQKLSPGGAISYVEVPDMQGNIEAVLSVIKFMYENIMYAEINSKSDYCQKCGWSGEIKIVEDGGKLVWECPNCKNRDQKTMNVARRTCGYIGTNFWNQGRTQEIKERVLHL